jgi:hypothetical protein
MRRRLTILIAVLLGLFALYTLAAVFLCEGTLHPSRKGLNGKVRLLAVTTASRFDARLEAVQIPSVDGARLSAWLFRPNHGTGDAVILLHGHGDNRGGMLPFVPMFLRRQYSVLVPDARAHGESGGDFATFGLYESRDLRRWVDWWSTQSSRGCVYGLGESMGAAILLQALPVEPRFCAVVAESPYATFREVAYDRLGRKVGVGPGISRALFGPLLSEAFLYARLRYGIDFNRNAPADSVAATRVPILLVHGERDFNIPLRHCQAILNNHSGVMEFWPVLGAGHTGAFRREPEEFERRVTDWFARQARP